MVPVKPTIKISDLEKIDVRVKKEVPNGARAG